MTEQLSPFRRCIRAWNRVMVKTSLEQSRLFLIDSFAILASGATEEYSKSIERLSDQYLDDTEIKKDLVFESRVGLERAISKPKPTAETLRRVEEALKSGRLHKVFTAKKLQMASGVSSGRQMQLAREEMIKRGLIRRGETWSTLYTMNEEMGCKPKPYDLNRFDVDSISKEGV